MGNSKYTLDIDGNASGLDRALAKSKRGLESFQNNVISIKGAISALAIGAGINAILDATISQQDAQAQLAARIKSTGAAAGYSIDQLVEMANAMQRLTLYSDDQIESMQALLLTFTNIRGPQVQGATQAVLDMSTAMGQDLKSSAIQVGKALNDPILGLTALSRVGVSFSDSQKQVITQMVKTGDVAGAQKIILAELEREFGGAAEAAKNTFGGALKHVTQMFGNLLEGNNNDGMRASTEELKKLDDLLQDPNTVEAFDHITSAVIRLVGALAQAVTKFAEFSQWVGEIAAKSQGYEADPVKQIEDKISQMKFALNSGTNRGRIQAGVGGWSQDQIKAEIARLEAQKKSVAETLAQSAAINANHPKKPEQKLPTAPAAPNMPYSISTSNSASGAKAQLSASQRLMLSIQEQAATYGKTAAEVQLYKLRMAGATEAQLSQAKALLDGMAAQEKMTEDQKKAADAAAQQKQALDDAAQALKDQLDPMDSIKRDMEQYNQLLESGRITTDEWAAATFDAQKRIDELNGVVADAKKPIGEMDQFTKQAAKNMQSAFANFLFDPFNEGLKGLGQNFAKVIQRMAAEAAAAQIANKLFGDYGKTGQIGGVVGNFFGNNGAGSGIGSFIANLFAADGAAFNTGGVRFFANGGVVDSPSAFGFKGGLGVMGEAGPEAIMPLTRGQNGKLGIHAQGTGGVTVQMTVYTQDAQSFQKSSGQIAADVGTAIARAQRRNS